MCAAKAQIAPFQTLGRNMLSTGEKSIHVLVILKQNKWEKADGRRILYTGDRKAEQSLVMCTIPQLTGHGYLGVESKIYKTLYLFTGVPQPSRRRLGRDALPALTMTTCDQTND